MISTEETGYENNIKVLLLRMVEMKKKKILLIASMDLEPEKRALGVKMNWYLVLGGQINSTH